jgi:uncharacterized protein (TIGR00369 family)
MTSTDNPDTLGGTPDDFPLETAFLSTPLHRALGVSISRTAEGILLSGEVDSSFARGDGLNTLHGGAVATLLDAATVWAAVASTSSLWMTLDLRIDYIRPAPIGPLEVVGSVLHRGRTVSRARAELRDGEGRLAAIGLATLIAQQPRGGT